jgi:tetratricopeptide (TPR) repeat protein
LKLIRTARYGCALLWILGGSVAIAGEVATTSSARLPPENCVRQMRAARIARLDGNRERSLELLEQAADSCPQDLTPLVAMLEHHYFFGLPEARAKSVTERLAARLADPASPVPPGALTYLVGVAEAGEDDLQRILDAVLSRLGRFENDPRLIEAAATLQERLGRLEDAREMLGRLLELSPSPGLRWKCLMLDRHLERWDGVADSLAELIEAGEESPFVRMSYIEALGKTGQFDEILLQLESLDLTSLRGDLLARQTLWGLLRQVAWDLRDLGLDDQAERVFRRLLELNPEDVRTRTTLIYLYSDEQERLAHETALQEQLAEEDDPYVLLQQAGDLMVAGNFEQALQLLQRAAEELPHVESASFNLGMAAIRLERWSTALAAFEHSTSLNPKRAEGFLYRGVALQNLDRCEQAVVHLRTAVELNSDMPQSYYFLWACYKALGDNAAAERALNEYNARIEGQ